MGSCVGKQSVSERQGEGADEGTGEGDHSESGCSIMGMLRRRRGRSHSDSNSNSSSSSSSSVPVVTVEEIQASQWPRDSPGSSTGTLLGSSRLSRRVIMRSADGEESFFSIVRSARTGIAGISRGLSPSSSSSSLAESATYQYNVDTDVELELDIFWNSNSSSRSDGHEGEDHEKNGEPRMSFGMGEEVAKEEEVSKCVVCLEDMGAKVEVSQLTCSHSFHERCIRPWLRTAPTCPICRRSPVLILHR